MPQIMEHVVVFLWFPRATDHGARRGFLWFHRAADHGVIVEVIQLAVWWIFQDVVARVSDTGVEELITLLMSSCQLLF